MRLLDLRTILVLAVLVSFGFACDGGGGKDNGENDSLSAAWNDYREALAVLQTYYDGLPTKINVSPVWFESLQVPLDRFSSRVDQFTVSGMPQHGVGYGSFASLTGNRQIVFYSNWIPEVPSSGSAFALEYINGVPTTLSDFPIQGSTHSWVVTDQGGTQSVVFMGVDEGKSFIDPSVHATSPSYMFDLDTRTWSTLAYLSTSHNSIPFDYDDDGDEDVVAQAWHEPFSGSFYILRNDSGAFTPIPLSDATGVVGGMSVAPLGYQNDGNFWLYVGDGVDLPEFGIGGETNYILHFAPNLDDVVNAVPVPTAYFEAPVFEDVPQVVPEWEGNVGTSHDVSAKALDLDQDGDLDLIVSSMIWSNEQPYTVLQFLVNDNGTYVDDTDNRLYNWSLVGVGPHRLDFIDVNGDGFTDILVSDHGSALWDKPDVDPAVTTGSRVLINDGTGYFVTVIHQQVNDGFGFRPSFIPSLDSNNKLRWTVIDPRGTSTVEVITRSLNMELSTGPNMTDPAASGAPGFNEFYYLRHNPDAVQAIENGTYTTGLAHYLAIGAAEGRRAYAPGAIID